MKNRRILAAIALVLGLVLASALVIYLFFPKVYTDPNSIGNYNECENVGYPIAQGNEGSICTLPNGKTFESNGL